MISSMFPVIQMENVLICNDKFFFKANLKMLKKVILFNLESESDVVYFRHYHACSIPANIN